MSDRRIARVVLDSPLPQLDRLFDYAIPDHLVELAQPGVRVRVPLRVAGRVVDGFVIEVAQETDAERALSELDDVVSPVAVLPSRLYELTRRAADRAAGSAIDVLRVAVPRRMARAEKSWIARGPAASEPLDPASVAWAEDVLAAYPDLPTALTAGRRIAVSAIAGPAEAPDGAPIGRWSELLAAAAIAALSAQRSAVLVVPDHRDLSQLEAVLGARVPSSSVVRLDAAQSASERYAAYLRTLDAAPVIVLGNRSAVYAPVAQLGLVALWDDGDPLLREPLSPGIHARDAALLRHEHEGGALLFAGHTRTADVERLVGLGWLDEVRATRARHPRVVLSPLSDGESPGVRVPAAAFAAARAALATGPVLVQVARPGYAPVLTCASCRQPARCAACSGPLYARARGSVPQCRACGRRADAWACTHCAGTQLRLIGAGTERTADELGRAFPGTRVIVSDGTHPLTRVDAVPSLVIATRGAEPLSPGGYSAVLLLDGERMLLAEDLRIAEHCLRWWSNAAALAAPGAPVHLVGVSGPLGRTLATWTQPAFARTELAERTPLRMPPAVRVASLEGSRPSVESAIAATVAEAHLDPAAVLGPVETSGGWRALIRFEYHTGAAVARALRAAVVDAAVRTRRPRRGSSSTPTGLRVRLDLPDISLEENA